AWQTRMMAANSRSMWVPRLVREKVEKGFINNYRRTQAANLMTDEEILGKLVKSYLDVDVYFRNEQAGTLRDGDLKYESSRGGGRIDLKEAIAVPRGSFYMSFQIDDTDGKLPNVNDYEIYYWSTHR